MDTNEAKQERRIGHVPSEMEQLEKAVSSLEVELGGLGTVLTPVLRSQPPSPTCDAAEPDIRSDCPLANEIASSRRTTERLTRNIKDLKDCLEV